MNLLVYTRRTSRASVCVEHNNIPIPTFSKNLMISWEYEYNWRQLNNLYLNLLPDRYTRADWKEAELSICRKPLYDWQTEDSYCQEHIA